VPLLEGLESGTVMADRLRQVLTGRTFSESSDSVKGIAEEAEYGTIPHDDPPVG
jgi:hypothetical protein